LLFLAELKAIPISIIHVVEPDTLNPVAYSSCELVIQGFAKYARTDIVPMILLLKRDHRLFDFSYAELPHFLDVLCSIKTTDREYLLELLSKHMETQFHWASAAAALLNFPKELWDMALSIAEKIRTDTHETIIEALQIVSRVPHSLLHLYTLSEEPMRRIIFNNYIENHLLNTNEVLTRSARVLLYGHTNSILISEFMEKTTHSRFFLDEGFTMPDNERIEKIKSDLCDLYTDFERDPIISFADGLSRTYKYLVMLKSGLLPTDIEYDYTLQEILHTLIIGFGDKFHITSPDPIAATDAGAGSAGRSSITHSYGILYYTPGAFFPTEILKAFTI
jgi:hypothetical protein